MEENKQQENPSENKENSVETPDLEKPYAIRNFTKELKRVTWPTKKKNNIYFFLTFIFIIFLIILFALISLGASGIIKSIGAN